MLGVIMEVDEDFTTQPSQEFSPSASPLFYMKEALKEAKKAARLGEVPIGAVLVYQDKIVARAYNTRQSKQRTLGHAELNLIAKANLRFHSWRLEDMDVYVTLEPCFMCAAALLQARIKKVYFAVTDPKGGAVVSKYRLYDRNDLYHQVKWEAGLCEEEAQYLLQNFFRALREEKKQRRPKNTENN